MDENKAMQNQNPEGAGETTFTQDQVNKIVSDRLAREKAKSEAALAEREQQLAQRELLLTAKEKLTESGLPVELLDALNVSSPEAMEKAITTLKGVIDKIKGEARPVKFYGAKPAEAGRAPQMGGDSQLRKAMGLS
ncbi:DUF4355 domain-containing protein [Acutalibacter sp. 1XD8-33]|uniref:capsid assembly scaffolding protein Gp46 family protein n=1 Tax=Acutalibacter sp. 1XD8-33 TaxID=2320081 RepID=UPI000EA0E6CC|nr:DUF4355 domain-containing protein [Acutalibacter sp. 1XD8-33]RKJ39784.1 DUF4355 domain-containing protein [Acutalibacter sp. 1XD8-33]